MAKPAKPQQRPSPFNALLELRRSKHVVSDPPGQTVKHPNIQESKLLDIQTSSRLAKSIDPEFMKFTTYVRKKTHHAVKLRLVEQERELSDLVEELLAAWLQKETSTNSSGS
jgi:hypothetical protein